MKRIFFIATVTTALVVGATAAAYAQNANSDSSPPEKNIMISKSEFIRMSNILIDVNTGKLPISALKDAQPLIEKRPDMLSKKIWDQLKVENQK